MKRITLIIAMVCFTAVIIFILLKCTMSELRKFAADVNNGKVTHDFRVSAPTIQKTNRLVILSTTQNAEHTTTYEKDFWGLKLPTIEVHSSFPVTFNYYLDLTEDWRFEYSDNVLTVYAPQIRFLEPSIDVSKLVLRSKNSILRFDEEELKTMHMKGLMTFSKITAFNNINNIYDAARISTADFVKNWVFERFITREYEQKEFEKTVTIKVHFEREELKKEIEP